MIGTCERSIREKVAVDDVQFRFRTRAHGIIVGIGIRLRCYRHVEIVLGFDT